MATAVHTKEVGSWSETFPTQQTTFKESLMFMKRLLGVAVCNIAYLRMMFPNDAFVDKSLEGIHLKILKSSESYPQVVHLITCLKGVFDALDKKYLKMLIFMVHPDPHDTSKVLDSYTFQFSYNETSEVSIYSNNKKISTMTNADKTKEATLKMLRTLIVSASTLEPLPSVYSLSMKLFYYDDVTPTDYEPPGFEPAEGKECTYNGDPRTITIGSVSTIYHTLNLQLTTASNNDPENRCQAENDCREAANMAPGNVALQSLGSQETRDASPEDEGPIDCSFDHNEQEPPVSPQPTKAFSGGHNKLKMDNKIVPSNKRKVVEDEDVEQEEDVCNEASKLSIRNKLKKQSKSKYMKFGTDSPNFEKENSKKIIHGKSSRRNRKN